ncbi:MAG: 4Fe-4S dicluster domain-containing protein [Archaeoglobaceae archaeon]|nr:4Fe-4S dicluster domain-containing protein [Archaeoglobaceae archaeon]MDW7989271.1 4Fe-4S dicluster domain-containing protein [Archaeoglobaceae archaeon]
MGKKIKKENLEKLFADIGKEYKIIAPIKKRENYVFAEVEDFSEIVLDYPMTILPPKEFIMPYKEPIFVFENGEFGEVIPNEKIALFALHMCDVNAIGRLDFVFWNDLYYKARREKMLIVGISCKPIETCFCKSTGANVLTNTCDLFLKAEEDYYVGFSMTEKGRKLLSQLYFGPETVYVREVKIDYDEKLQFDIYAIGKRILEDYNNPVWEETAKNCLACTNCTLVCPLCYCFDVIDETFVVPEEGKRIRCWDSCLLLSFARVAGGHNFRKDLKARYRNVYTHKFRTFVDEFGVPSCVGCGRCTTFCPAEIDMREILFRLGGA